MEISKVKNGQKLVVDGVGYVAHVSKGRKLLQSESITNIEYGVKKKIKGYECEQTRYHKDVTIVFDYGKTISTTMRRCYPSESYDYPNGITSNRWDLYEYYATH